MATGGRPAAKGPVVLVPPGGGYRVRLSEGLVTDLGWGLAVQPGDIAFRCLVRRPGELWCAPDSLRGPAGNHPMARLIAVAEAQSPLHAVVDDVDELPTPEEVLRQTRSDTFQAAWSQTPRQNQLLLKLNRRLANEIDWGPDADKKRRIALIPVGGILMLLSHDRYNEARSEPFARWLDIE